MATGGDKYFCRVPIGLQQMINRVSTRRKTTKNDALRYLVELALANPEHPKAYFNGDKTVGNTLKVSNDFHDSTLSYRDSHGLPNQKSAFFYDALERGAAIFAKQTESAK